MIVQRMTRPEAPARRNFSRPSPPAWPKPSRKRNSCPHTPLVTSPGPTPPPRQDRRTPGPARPRATPVPPRFTNTAPLARRRHNRRSHPGNQDLSRRNHQNNRNHARRPGTEASRSLPQAPIRRVVHQILRLPCRSEGPLAPGAGQILSGWATALRQEHHTSSGRLPRRPIPQGRPPQRVPAPRRRDRVPRRQADHCRRRKGQGLPRHSRPNPPRPG